MANVLDVVAMELTTNAHKAVARTRSPKRALDMSEHDDAAEPQVHDRGVVDREAAPRQVDDLPVVGVGDARRGAAARCLRTGAARSRSADVALEVRVAGVSRGDEVALDVRES